MSTQESGNSQQVILASYWSILITWPECLPLIGHLLLFSGLPVSLQKWMWIFWQNWKQGLLLRVLQREPEKGKNTFLYGWLLKHKLIKFLALTRDQMSNVKKSLCPVVCCQLLWSNFHSRSLNFEFFLNSLSLSTYLIIETRDRTYNTSSCYSSCFFFIFLFL